MQRVLFGGGFASLLCLVGLLAPSPIRAADPEGKMPRVSVTYHAKGHEEEKTFDLSDPAQLETVTSLLQKGEIEHLKQEKPPALLDLQWDLGLWTLVVFLLLFFILKRFAWGPMLDGLQKREDNIRRAVEEAKEARAETRHERAEFQRKLDEAYQKIPQMMDEARRDAAHMAEELRSKAAADIQADRQRLRREIEMAKDQAIQDIYNQGVTLATMISAKALGRHVSEEDHRRLVDETLSELRNAGRG